MTRTLGLLMTTLIATPAAATAAAASAPAEDEDPHRWLEEVAADKPLAWVKERNDESTGELTRSRAFKTLQKRLLAIFDSDQKIPYVTKLGPHYYNFWKDAAHVRGLWRRATLDEYRKADPAWETVIDLDALAKQENENWVWHGAQCLKPAYRKCLVALSRGGADADVTREFDLETRSFVKDGFFLPEAKGGASWIDDDTLYVFTDFGPGSMTKSGYPRVVKLWKRGTPLASAGTIFEGQSTDVAVSASRDHTKGFEREFVSRSITFYTSELHLRTGGKLVKLDVPLDAQTNVHREWMYVELRSDWNVGGKTFPAGALLATRFDAFMAGERRFDVLFTPTDRKSLAGYSPTLNHLLLSELDNVRNRVFVLTHGDGTWKREPLPGLPELGTASARAVDPDESDAYFLDLTDYVTPTSLHLGTVGQGPAPKLKQLPAFFKAQGLVVRQHEVASKDGTRIPYFEVSRVRARADGKRPTLLYGYGGFEVSMMPGYSASVGAGWLEKGGVYVVANIRGGGEFGPRWHQAALKANRHKAYEDFAAVAEDLIRREITSPKHLGIMGGSNGGLLMGNMLTRRPELFGAIVCSVPLLDMRRYHTLLAGASWMGEYGNPDEATEWEFIRTFSPYHNVSAALKPPRVLFTTSTRDDRVHPGHARKMVAKMKALGHDVLYYENVEGGHAGAANNKQQAFMSALSYTFLWNQLAKPVRKAK